ncbi:MAG TPA: BON domain-containing protein [Methylococcales bacterium]
MKTKNGYKQTSLSSKVLLIAGLSMVIGLAGCQEEGTAEQEGKKIDRAVEKASEKIEAAKQSMNEKIDDSAKSTKGTLESAGQKIDQQTEEAKQKIDQETEKAGKKLENAKESVTDSAEKTGEYISDSVITAKVKTAIFGDPVLRTSHIDVTTVNGVVKLSGTVDSEQSLGRAMELAGSQKDVNSVETTLVVVEPRK